MSILTEICDASVWHDFYTHKLEKSHLTPRDAERLESFIQSRAYSTVTDLISDPLYSFMPPLKRFVNKSGSQKKRVVYSFAEDESMVLKLIAYLLYRYDALQPPNCYSFRRDFGAKHAIHSISATSGIDGMYCYKLDIKNYFNSIKIDMLLPILKSILSDDEPLFDFLERLLTAHTSICCGQLITEERGAMAGTPISPFLANIYLRELDAHFYELGAIYARYSDDIIVFANTEAELDEYIRYISDTLAAYGLEINTDKEKKVMPEEAWDFLGIEYSRGIIDLSRSTKMKLKGKIRRKARALRRWKLKKGISDEKALIVFTRVFNKKFFESYDPNVLTWARWFFPLITTDTSLREIDAYMRENMRYIITGRHSRANYRVGHAFLKQCGHKSLVNEYYRFKSRS